MLAVLMGSVLTLKIALTDLHGRQITLLPSSARRGVVAFFVLSGCPNANAYAPEMNRLAGIYGPQGWKFFLVFADQPANLRDLAVHAKQFGYTFPVVCGDSGFQAVAHVTKSPEAAVLSPAGQLLYHGRIDDRFYALGKQRLAPRTHDLRTALDAIDSGRPVPNPSTNVVGCFLPKS